MIDPATLREWLRELDLAQLAVSAAMGPDRQLMAVDGINLKTNALWNASRVGSLRYLVVSTAQKEFTEDGPLGDGELSTITVADGLAANGNGSCWRACRATSSASSASRSSA